MTRQEIWVMLCTYQGIRTLMWQVLAATGTDPKRLSFTHRRTSSPLPQEHPVVDPMGSIRRSATGQ